MPVALLLGLLGLPAADPVIVERPDLVVADFEGTSWAPWTATGTAFGDGPARGTLPGQMDVSGFDGKGLVNSFVKGDDSTGTLTSPHFPIERKYINFLVGGGAHAGETCIELRIGDRVVQSTTGPNDRAGGSERLEWATWDVGSLVGQSATIRIVDTRRGGWGHINVDQIVQSDTRREAAPAERTIEVTARYLHLPVTRDAPVRRLTIRSGDRVIHDFEIRLTPAGAKPSFWAFTDLEPHRASRLTITGKLPGGAPSLEGLKLEDQVPNAAAIYREADRPRFHFTSRVGWLNDPNGLVYHDGSYHLYYQHNPYGWDWGNMHWGHAVSPDLVHWVEKPIAIYPHRFGDWAFSGSAVVDHDNTSGFGQNGKAPLVAAYTSTGRGECIVFSNDGGATFQEYPGNPVVKHEGRDPRLLWHTASKQWVMAVYDESEGKRWIAFHTSPDLKRWTFQSKIADFFECPDLFELPIRGKADQSRWVLYAADGAYLLGRFDGRTFTPDEPGKKHRVWHGNFYAAQSYSDAPEGRRIQVGWGQGITFDAMPFNQQMCIPVELTLRETPDGLRMFAFPVREVDALSRVSRSVEGTETTIKGTTLDATITARVGPEGDRLRSGSDGGIRCQPPPTRCQDSKPRSIPSAGRSRCSP
ncbi:MAG: glycoside hydrolase family 32 protein [Isosphaeraceae bacterium]